MLILIIFFAEIDTQNGSVVSVDTWQPTLNQYMDQNANQ